MGVLMRRLAAQARHPRLGSAAGCVPVRQQDATPLGLGRVGRVSQGSSRLATLSWRAQPLWGWPAVFRIIDQRDAAGRNLAPLERFGHWRAPRHFRWVGGGTIAGFTVPGMDSTNPALARGRTCWQLPGVLRGHPRKRSWISVYGAARPRHFPHRRSSANSAPA